MIWVLEDPRPGTAAQALGIAEALGLPFRRIALGWSAWAGFALPWPSLLGLDPQSRAAFAPPWPRLVISAGRRAAPAARWLRARGARSVHCMRPGPGAADFDLLVLGRHDNPPIRPGILPILGATHRVTAAGLREAGLAFPALGALPAPRVALLLGGPVRGLGLAAETATRIVAAARALGGSVMASTSRRTGEEAAGAVAVALQGHPHTLFRWGTAGANPFLGVLAHADAVVVSADSVSMLSEALVTAAPVFWADTGGLGPRHQALCRSLAEAGQARPLTADATLFSRAPLNETERVATSIRDMGWVA